MRSTSLFPCVGILLVVLATGAPARAADGPPHLEPRVVRRVSLDLQACPSVPEVELRRIVAIELGDLVLAAGEPPADDIDSLAIVCENGRAHINTGKPRFNRTLGLTEFPEDAVPRALALAAIEVLADLNPDVRARIESRAQRGAAVAPAPEAVEPQAAPAPVLPPPIVATVEPPRASVSSSLMVSGVLLDFVGSAGLLAWGGRAAYVRAAPSGLELGLDAELARGTRRVAAGDASGLLVSAGAGMGWGHGGRTWAAALALGGRAGLARLAGSPADPAATTGAQVWRFWGGPCLGARLRAARGSLMVELSAEAGYAVIGADGSDTAVRVLSARGLWLGAAVGVGFRRSR